MGQVVGWKEVECVIGCYLLRGGQEAQMRCSTNEGNDYGDGSGHYYLVPGPAAVDSRQSQCRPV